MGVRTTLHSSSSVILVSQWRVLSPSMKGALAPVNAGRGKVPDSICCMYCTSGGQQVLLDVRGQDCTELFDSMHSDVTLPLRMLAKLEEVGDSSRHFTP